MNDEKISLKKRRKLLKQLECYGTISFFSLGTFFCFSKTVPVRERNVIETCIPTNSEETILTYPINQVEPFDSIVHYGKVKDNHTRTISTYSLNDFENYDFSHPIQTIEAFSKDFEIEDEYYELHLFQEEETFRDATKLEKLLLTLTSFFSAVIFSGLVLVVFHPYLKKDEDYFPVRKI